MAVLIDQLGLEKVEQFCTDTLSCEDETGQVQRGRGFSSMVGFLSLKMGWAR